MTTRIQRKWLETLDPTPTATGVDFLLDQLATLEDNLGPLHSATVAPTATDDSAHGYYRGSHWINTETDKVYYLTDDTVGAAVWTDLTSGGDTSGIETRLTTAEGEIDLLQADNLKATLLVMGDAQTLSLPSNRGTDGQVLTTSGTATSWSTVSGSGGVANPMTADLDVGSYKITSTSNAKVVVEPNGSGPLQGRSDGNTRGTYATDWQRYRTANSQVANGAYSTLGGGAANTASGGSSTVSGGSTNVASGPCSTVIGGQSNSASSDYAIAGGYGSTASNNSALALGYQCSASAYGSTAFGRNCLADHYGSVAQSSGTGCRTFVATAWAINGGESTVLGLDGGGTHLTMTANKIWVISAYVVCGSGTTAGAWRIEACVQADPSAYAILIGSPSVTTIGSTLESHSCAIEIQEYGPGVNVAVNGAGTWGARIEVTEIPFTMDWGS